MESKFDLQVARDVTESLRVLHHAIQQNQFGMVKGILSDDPSLLESSSDGDGKTPLMISIESRNLMICGYLLGLGANIDAADHSGRPLLHCIAELDDSDKSVQLLHSLIECGAALFKMWKGDTFLHLLAREKKKKLFKAAIEHGHLKDPIGDGTPVSQTKGRRLASMRDSKGRALMEVVCKFGKERDGKNQMEKVLRDFIVDDHRDAVKRGALIPDVSSPPLPYEVAEDGEELSSSKRFKKTE